MIAFHFPPLAGSSGIQRTLRFVQELPHFGWRPDVLTAHSRAYERTSSDLLTQVPRDVRVQRSFALDTARHLAIGGRYMAAMARPDRWVSWKLGAVHDGLKMVREGRPDVIWSTYPIATAHLIGAEIARRTGLPWVADFRDPMAQDGYPADPLTWRQFKSIEELAMQHAALNVFTTPGAARMYVDRYPFAAGRIAVVENGYDEESFAAVEHQCADCQPLTPGTLTILHSGIVYPSERDPTALFCALGELRRRGMLTPGTVRLRFRAPEHVGLLEGLIDTHGLQELVEICPPLPYRDALREMMAADALLVMQGPGCNEQIPAKVYEYLRARRPMLGLIDPAGDTADLLRSAGVQHLSHLCDAKDIAAMLTRFVDDLRTGRAPRPHSATVQRASRRERAAELACLMDRLHTGSQMLPAASRRARVP